MTNDLLSELRQPAWYVFLYGGDFLAVFIAGSLICLVTEQKFSIWLVLLTFGYLVWAVINRVNGREGEVHWVGFFESGSPKV